MPNALDTRLLEALKTVSGKVRSYKALRLGEQDTKASLIDPVLEALGWDIRDPGEVCREFKLTSQDRPADYALKIDRVPKLLLEAKRLGEDLSEHGIVGQVLGYATMAGVSWCVITDGEEYRFYNSGAANLDADRKFLCLVKVTDGDLSAVARVLELISRANLQAKLIESFWNTYYVDRRVKEALDGLVSQAHADLVRVVRKHTSGLSPKEVGASLRRLRVQVDAPRVFPDGCVGPSPVVITLQDVIAAGLLKPPVPLVKEYKGQNLEATLHANGELEFQGQRYFSCSPAAEAARKAVTGKSMATNGWSFWQVVDGQGKRRSLEELRAQVAERHGAPPAN